MSLRMSKQAIIELLNSNAVKYRKTRSRKAKGELQKQLMELTGYKSSKSIVRHYSRTRKRKRVEKRGRHPMLPTWLKAYSKRHEIDEEVQKRILSVSPATLDFGDRNFEASTFR